MCEQKAMTSLKQRKGALLIKRCTFPFVANEPLQHNRLIQAVVIDGQLKHCPQGRGYPLSLWVSAWVVSPGRLPGLTEIQEFYLHLADGQSAFDILIGQGLPLQLGATELLGHQAGDNGAENGGDNDGSSHGCGGGLHLVG